MKSLTRTSTDVAALTRAHLWRMARGRRLQLVRLLVPYSSVLLLVFIPRIFANDAGSNGTSFMAIAGLTNGVAEPYSANIGGAIQLVPMLAGLLSGLAAASVAQTFVSNQRAQGDIEVLLSARYKPQDIVGATLRFTFTLAAALWAAAMLIGSLLIGITLVVYHTTLTPAPWYVFSYLVPPLLTTLCGATLSCMLCYVIPDRTLTGGSGVTGGRGIVAFAGMLPGLLAGCTYIVVPPEYIALGSCATTLVLAILITVGIVSARANFHAEKFAGN